MVYFSTWGREGSRARRPGGAEFRRGTTAVLLSIPVRLRRRGVELKLVLADREPPRTLDRSLIANLARGLQAGGT